MHYILFYDVVDDYMSRRAEFRVEHLALAKKSFERGELVLGGALADPADEVLIVFKSRSVCDKRARHLVARQEVDDCHRRRLVASLGHS